MAASEHELKFKASVDMSKANAEIQSAARNFNIGMVRQAVSMFGDQLESLADSMGATKLSESIKEMTSAMSNAIRAFQAGGPLAAAASVLITALNKMADAAKTASDAMLGAWNSVERYKHDSANAENEANFAAANPIDQSKMVAQLEAKAGAERAELETLANEIESKGAIFNQSTNDFDVPGNAEAAREFKDLQNRFNMVRDSLAADEALLGKWKGVIDQRAEADRKATEAEIKAEEDAQRKQQDAANANQDRVKQLFAAVDRTEYLNGIRDRLSNSGTWRGAYDEIVKAFDEESMKLNALRKDPNADANEVQNVMARRDQMQALLDLADKVRPVDEAKAPGQEQKDETSAPLLQKLEGMSGLAAIGGSVAGENPMRAQVDELRQIREIVKFIQYNTEQQRGGVYA